MGGRARLPHRLDEMGEDCLRNVVAFLVETTAQRWPARVIKDAFDTVVANGQGRTALALLAAALGEPWTPQEEPRTWLESTPPMRRLRVLVD